MNIGGEAGLEKMKEKNKKHFFKIIIKATTLVAVEQLKQFFLWSLRK